jgi:DNA-binding CsgD family transcriptional regulator
MNLTKRETELLALVAVGLSNKEIAACLSIAYPTVRNHLWSVYTKLNVNTRLEAVLWYQVAANVSAKELLDQYPKRIGLTPY